jgi:hypothetical protein
MQRRMGELFGGRLALRIGVNTGDVVVGRPREGSSFVTGDAINVCARLEQAAAPGEIQVGERTVAAAGGAFEFGEAATVQAKGKPGGVVCRRLVRALSLTRPRPRGLAGCRRCSSAATPNWRSCSRPTGKWRPAAGRTWSLSSVTPGSARRGWSVSSGAGWAGMADQHQLSSQGLRNYQSWARQVNRSAEQLLRQGVDEGLVRPDVDIPIAVNLLNSALTLIARWYHPTDRLKPDQIHDQVMKVLHGLLLQQPAVTAPS